MFKTHKLQIVAYLLAKGAVLDHFERVGSTVHFYFEDNELCQQLREEFLTSMPPERVFWIKLNDAKDIIFASG